MAISGNDYNGASRAKKHTIMTTDTADSTPTDGRRLRTVRNRKKITEALLQLVKSGDFSPGAEEVADVAGVGLRSVFRHFNDIESLYREVGEEFMRQIQPLIDKPLAGDDWRERLDALLIRKSELMQECLHMFMFGRLHRHESHYIRIEQEKARGMERKVLTNILPPEIVKDKELFEAVDLTVSMDAWVRLRKEQGLSVRKSLAVIRRTLDALLVDYK